MNFTKFAVSMDEDAVFVTAQGMDSVSQAFIFATSLNIVDGTVNWINRFFADTELLENIDQLMQSVKISLEYSDGETTDDLYLYKRYMLTNPHR